ncbi:MULTISPECIES: 2-succinyl-6-hydroxy-2,4-cyclohexadiene-1-carboxylate synthase [Bacillus]|uniref:2-succinyl-6-hydroxy-2, 4-cyclohexadiene-1-carboxylate synthase n=1 Tax=Bacillus TaxID=1386 RepID=UPI00065E6C6A|nr:2-succinyl-6-hydroxy-2,4-cyclohexadiene-1-carboxylate synthase [Bacillus smithii]AKP48224.1 2-succinyl-6-hydroxy-2,4-cyclohexadiene-1carboxylate synthase [Bacillus smithii]
MNMTVNGRTYYFTIAGKGEPLLFLHGFTGDHTTWDEIVAKLQKDYQCISIDILGHGNSAHPENSEEYAIEKIAGDVIELLRRLNIQKINVIGYSMGGRLALTMAVLYPKRVKRLILESSSPGLKTETERSARRKRDHALAEKILQAGIRAFVDEWEKIPLFASQSQLPIEIRKKIREQRLRQHPLGLANSLIGMGTGAQPSWWSQLDRLDMPVLLITGSLDVKFKKIAQEMKKMLPNGRWEEVEGAGHAIHVEDSQKFGTIVNEFISST